MAQMLLTQQASGNIPLERHLAGPLAMSRPASTSASTSSRGMARRLLVFPVNAAIARRVRGGADRLHVDKPYLRALAESALRPVASLDAELPRRVVDRDDPIPLLDRQRGGGGDAQPHVLDLWAMSRGLACFSSANGRASNPLI